MYSTKSKNFVTVTLTPTTTKKRVMPLIVRTPPLIKQGLHFRASVIYCFCNRFQVQLPET